MSRTLLAEPGVQNAIVAVMRVRPDADRAQLEAILDAFENDFFRGRGDAAYWTPKLLTELAHDDRDRAKVAARRRPRRRG